MAARGAAILLGEEEEAWTDGMLRTRLWMGAVLVALALGVLLIDQRLAPWYPFLFALVMALAAAACWEMRGLLPAAQRPSGWLCHASISTVLAANWVAAERSWPWVAGALAATTLAGFLVEMASYREPGESVMRMANLAWMACYLGLLPCFLVQLRWSVQGHGSEGFDPGTLGLALAIFVPKFGDIGAYFAGRLVGRHPLAPTLSPKKTWEGAAGGLAASMVTAVGIDQLGPVLPGGTWGELAFGATVGLTGMLGDLGESLIKRDCRRKDASQAVPGFGGVLDVIDSVIFAAPVAYCWLK
jgi:phosphatidate cytidylyltransferase